MKLTPYHHFSICFSPHTYLLMHTHKGKVSIVVETDVVFVHEVAKKMSLLHFLICSCSTNLLKALNPFFNSSFLAVMTDGNMG